MNAHRHVARAIGISKRTPGDSSPNSLQPSVEKDVISCLFHQRAGVLHNSLAQTLRQSVNARLTQLAQAEGGPKAEGYAGQIGSEQPRPKTPGSLPKIRWT